MGKVLNDLLDKLRLEKLDVKLFRGEIQDFGSGTAFVGQVMAQAVSAANETVDSKFKVHSFHSYFLRDGEKDLPVIYEVEILRDGKSILSRGVKAIQNGVQIFHLTVSFKLAEKGYEHQDTMPNVPPPEELISEQEMSLIHIDMLPDHLRHKLVCGKPIEMRPVTLVDPVDPEIEAPKRFVWIKANGKMPNNLNMHSYVLAYASNLNFLVTALQPHGVSPFAEGMQVVTIDHSMWYHHDCRLDEWLLYVIKSLVASDGRALVTGKFFTRKGLLVASTIQEGLIRKRT